MGYPPFSDGGRYLEFHYLDDEFPEIGSPKDDFINFFTARLLLILEGTYIFNRKLYYRTAGRIIREYIRVYYQYREDFFPSFLINDIVRYWKTLCLNYEHRCGKPGKYTDIELRIDLIKLKFSRLLTCYSMVLALAARGEGIKAHEMRALVRKRPLERLSFVAQTLPIHKSKIEGMTSLYDNFLRINHLEKKELYREIRDNDKYKEILDNAEKFGDFIYGIVIDICKKNSKRRFLIV